MFIMQMSNIIRQGAKAEVFFLSFFPPLLRLVLPEKSLVKKLSYLVCAKDRTTYVTMQSNKKPKKERNKDLSHVSGGPRGEYFVT